MNGSELRTRREALRWSQSELAQRASISIDYLRKIEAGTRAPAAITSARIRDCLEAGESAATEPRGDWHLQHPAAFARAVDLVLQIGPGVVEHLESVRRIQRDWEPGARPVGNARTGGGRR